MPLKQPQNAAPPPLPLPLLPSLPSHMSVVVLRHIPIAPLPRFVLPTTMFSRGMVVQTRDLRVLARAVLVVREQMQRMPSAVSVLARLAPVVFGI